MAVNLQLGALVLELPSHSSPLDINLAPSFGVDVTPDTAAVVFTGLEPSVVGAVESGAISFTGLVPFIALPRTNFIPVGELQVFGQDPEVITLTGAGAEVNPGEIITEGLIPEVLTPRVMRPTPGTVAHAGIAPAYVEGIHAYPGLGTSTFTGAVPPIPTDISLPLGNHQLTGQVPKAIINNIFPIPQGAVAFTGEVPEFHNNVYIFPPKGTALTAGIDPNVVASDHQWIDTFTGNMGLGGRKPNIFFEPPDITNHPASRSITEGYPVFFQIFATGAEPLTYQWYETTAGLLVGETGTTLTLPAQSLANDGDSYYCIVYDAFAISSQSNTAILTVTPLEFTGVQGGKTPAILMLSGGAGNYISASSLGGAASTGTEGIVMSQNASLVGDDMLYGAQLLGGHNLATGTGTLNWNSSTGLLIFTDSLGRTGAVTPGPDGYYMTTGYPGQVLIKKAGTLPVGNVTNTYTIADWQQNIFDDVGFNERSGPHENFRCLYMRNLDVLSLNNLAVSVRVDPKYGVVEIATEYPSTTVNAADATYVTGNALQKGGTFLLGARAEENVLSYVDAYHKNGPFILPAYERIYANDLSDGVTTQIASTIVDEEDSTNVLSALSWGDTLTWTTVPTGKFISFWLRRTIAAGSSGAAMELDKFVLDITYRRG